VTSPAGYLRVVGAGMTTVDGMPPEFGETSDEELRRILRRCEMDLHLSRNDPYRSRRIACLMDAALHELTERLASRAL
jgi:hypothetical protein